MQTGSAENFATLGTIGVEEEFYVVDERGRPVSGSDTLVYDDPPGGILEGRISHELFKCVLEVQTPIIENVDDAGETVRAVRDALVEHAAEHGFRVAGAGLHPAATWQDLEHATKPRYKTQLDRIQYPQHRNTTAGFHVHVGVDDPDKAVWITNEIRWYLPLVLAISVNSPYWNGFDTGLQSARAKIFEALPNTGMPTSFADFEEYESFERMMIASGSINDRGELWFEVRPHTDHGTVEVRSPDAQADPEVVDVFIEYVYALVMDLAARFEDGEPGRVDRREVLDENKWRAIRYGKEASFISRDQSGTVSLGEWVDTEASRLGVDGIVELYERQSGAARQREVFKREGLDALCESLVL